MSKESKRFADLVFYKNYRREILEILLEKPDYSFNINEISEQVSASYMSVRGFIEDLAEFGVVDMRKKGNLRLVSLNQESAYKEVFLSILRADTEPLIESADKYVSRLREECEKVGKIYLFGSVAKGTADRDSDIDVAVLAKKDRKEVKSICRRIATDMDRRVDNPIVPLVYLEEEFDRKLEDGGRLESEIKEFGIPL